MKCLELTINIDLLSCAFVYNKIMRLICGTASLTYVDFYFPLGLNFREFFFDSCWCWNVLIPCTSLLLQPKRVQMKNKLKVFRAMYDLTQEDLAEKVGVTRQTINAIEKRKYNPSLELAFKLAKLFEVKIEDIFIYDC